jgi:hypothetical protein
VLKQFDEVPRSRASDFSFLIEAVEAVPRDVATAQSRFGSSAAGRDALITTARPSKAAIHGTKRDTA